MGAKSTKASPSDQPAVTREKNKRLKFSRIRAASMPDMAAAAGGGVMCLDPGGMQNAMQKHSTHMILSHQLTPPPDYGTTSEEIRHNYVTVTDKMVKIWPVYAYLRNFDLNEVDLDIVEKITQVFAHLLEQYSLIQMLSADNKRLNATLREEDNVAGRSRSRPDLEKRMSADALHCGGRTSKNPAPVDLTKSDPTLDPKQKLMEDLQKMRDQALISSSKRRSVDPHHGDGNESCNPHRQRQSDASRIDELTARVKSLQDEVDTERKLRMAQSSTERFDKSHKAAEETVGHREMVRNRLHKDYERIAKYMMSEVKTELGHIHQAMEDRAKYQFLCSVMEECVKTCEAMKDVLTKSLKSVLLHPTKPFSSRDGTSGGRNRRGSAARTSVMENISLFESAGRSHHKATVNFRQYVEEGKLPHQLEKDAMEFVASISECVEAKPIAKETLERLKKTYPDILTDGLCSNTTFKKFLNECCKVAWSISILDPPLRLVVTPGENFNDEFHIPFRSQKRSDAQVDYYLWPVLLDEGKGEQVVVGKGRVCLTK